MPSAFASAASTIRPLPRPSLRLCSNPGQDSLGLLDVAIERNSYGRQLSSGIHPLQGRNGFPDTRGCFIRAPRILRVGPSVTVLATRDQDPVLVQQGHILAATFHPEMDERHPAYARFLSLASATAPQRGAAASTQP